MPNINTAAIQFMKQKKILILLLFLLAGGVATAQMRPVLYGGLDFFRDRGFEDNKYYSSTVGLQLFRWKFLAPEIGLESYNGTPAIRETSPRLEARFSTTHYTFAPKIMIGDEVAAAVFIPQYNTGKVHGRGYLYVRDGNTFSLEEEQKVSQPTSFWSFALGIEGQFIDSEIVYFSLLLKYNYVNSEDILQQLDFPKYGNPITGGSTEGLGLGLRVYFNPFALLEERKSRE